MSFMILGPDDWAQFQKALFDQLKAMGDKMSKHTEALAEIKANLTEASNEIVAKLDSLNADALSPEDQATLTEIRTMAAAQANIVPNVPAEPVDEEPVDEDEDEEDDTV